MFAASVFRLEQRNHNNSRSGVFWPGSEPLVWAARWFSFQAWASTQRGQEIKYHISSIIRLIINYECIKGLRACKKRLSR